MSEELKNRLNKNIVKIYISNAIGSTNFNLVVYTLFILSKGFGMEEFFIFESAYALASLFAQIPTGAFADKYGRKISIVLATVINIPAILMIIYSRNFGVIFAAMLIGGVGSSFYSGAGEALMYDTIKSLGKESEYKKINGRSGLYSSITAALGAVVGGWLAHFKLEYAWWAYFFVQFPMLLVDITLIDPPVHEKDEFVLAKHLKDSVWQAFRGDAAYFVMYSAVIVIFFSLGYWLWQPYLKSISIPVLYFGFIYAAENLLSGFVSSQAHKIEKKIGMSRSLIYIPLVLLISFVAESQQILIFGAVFIFIHAIVSGYRWPVLEDYLNSRIPSAQRATVLSIEAMINDGLFVILSPLLGYYIDLYSLKSAYLIMAAILLIVTFIFWLAFRKQKVSETPFIAESS